jgi:kanamycin kinase/aminoglycoside 3'-phosphotransferase-3
MEKEKGSRDDPMLRRRLPDSICQLTEGKACRREKTVLRGSELLIFDDCVLKITPCSREDEESVQIMRWLEGKLPVPKVLACEKNKEYQYLLMSRIPGRKAWDDPCLAHPAELLAVLAEAVKALWRVDVSDCPRTRDADTLLLKAKYNV